jgi:hypothetical protein
MLKSRHNLFRLLHRYIHQGSNFFFSPSQLTLQRDVLIYGVQIPKSCNRVDLAINSTTQIKNMSGCRSIQSDTRQHRYLRQIWVSGFSFDNSRGI